ncbi:MAG: hypothetical protein IT193_07205 [Propionibacteriaceae bacterium]|nr:hypothetical protein [Propionibacteriaceae bacterium]
MTSTSTSVQPSQTAVAAGTMATTPAAGVAAQPEFVPPAPSRTPRLLRRLQAAAAIALLLLGGLGTWVISELRTDLASAPEVSAQYARLGEVQNRLLEANALAAVGVIEGDGGMTDRAEAAGARLNQAAGLLVAAATARPQDTEAVAAISGHLVGYGQLLRAADGRDAKTAKALLDRADTQLDKQLLPALAALQTGLSEEAAARSWTESEFFVPLLAVLTVGFLGWISWVVAHRTRRVLNLGLVGAVVAALAILWVTVAAQQAAAAASTDSRNTQFARVVDLTDAANQLGTAQRIHAHAVLVRSWTQGDASAVDAAVKAAGGTDLPSGDRILADFKSAQNKLAALMAKGDWSGAAGLVLADGEEGLAGTAKSFDDAVSRARTEAVVAAAGRPDEMRDTLMWQLAAAVLAALFGAALAVAGMEQRLQEYR